MSRIFKKYPYICYKFIIIYRKKHINIILFGYIKKYYKSNFLPKKKLFSVLKRI